MGFATLGRCAHVRSRDARSSSFDGIMVVVRRERRSVHARAFGDRQFVRLSAISLLAAAYASSLRGDVIEQLAREVARQLHQSRIERNHQLLQ